MNENGMNHRVGYRFYPNDEELINHYLIPKVLGLESEVHDPIAEVDILKYEPCDLPEFSVIKSNDPYWYLFYQLDYKYLNSKRASRTTKGGYWKATCKDRELRSRDTKQLIGSKKTLVFHEGRVSKKVKSPSTKWVIHEYRVPADFPNPNAYVICRLKKKVEGKANTSTPVEGESSCQSPSDFVNHVAENTVIEGEGACPVDLPSRAYLEATESYVEQGLFYQDLLLPNYFSSDCNEIQSQVHNIELEEDSILLDSYLNNEREVYSIETSSHKNLNIEHEGLDWGAVGMSSAQPLESISRISYIKDGGISRDTNNEVAIAQIKKIDLPSQADMEAVIDYSELMDQRYGLSYKDLSLPNGFNSDSNKVQTQVDTIELEEDSSLLDSYLNNEGEAQPVETINQKNLVFESEGLDWGAVGMSSAQPLESISRISYIQDGGMSADTNNEVAVAQVKKKIPIR